DVSAIPVDAGGMIACPGRGVVMLIHRMLDDGSCGTTKPRAVSVAYAKPSARLRPSVGALPAWQPVTAQSRLNVGSWMSCSKETSVVADLSMTLPSDTPAQS